MLNLKSNFRNNTKGDILCPRCRKEFDNEQHLFEQCSKSEDLYEKYKLIAMKKYLNLKQKWTD